MSFGHDYANAYDAFYRTKDYAGEARFVCERLRTVAGDGALDILDLGCGTGMHDVEFVSRGHTVLGVDRSNQMLMHAQERRQVLDPAAQKRLSFCSGDARNFVAGRKFDAVVSLFHVMSYMSGEGDLDAALATARSHLRPDGVFLFDFWYGPAVLEDPPQRRERVIEQTDRRIRRITTPHWDRVRNIVKIEFDVEETDKIAGTSNRTAEEHVMRYFFEDGLNYALTEAGFHLVETGEWLTGRLPTASSFGVYALAKMA